jgi:glycosyltransferase involved in cell wall biosynthesis
MPKTPPVTSAKTPHILALCDSIATRPGAARTGFGRVAYNLFSNWPGVSIDIWGIGFDGHGYREFLNNPDWHLIPGGTNHWNSTAWLNAFLQQLEYGDYTHVFIIMDPDAISAGNFPTKLREICRKHQIMSVLYYPVDAPLPPPFQIIEMVDVAITFTEYGRSETLSALKATYKPIQVLPHGIEPHFQPVSQKQREIERAKYQVPDKANPGKMKPFLAPDDILMLNVNKNEWRKDPLRSLEILVGLRRMGLPVKLIMRMDPMSQVQGVHLERAADQMGLTLDKEWAHIGRVEESCMPALYAGADLALTTTLGEGWGFMSVEAAACGTPVAMPANTSLIGIGSKIAVEDARAVIFLEMETGFVCGYDNRLRHRVDLQKAIMQISTYLCKYHPLPRVELSPAIREWLSWPRIAGEFLKLMKIVPQSQCTSKNLRIEFTFSLQEKPVNSKQTNQTKGKNMSTAAKLTTGFQSTILASVKTSTGAASTLVAPPNWTSTDPTIVTVTPATDGLSAIIAGIAPGTATVTVTGEGDATVGVDTVKNSVDVTVTNPEASEIDLTVEAQVPIPAAAGAGAGGASATGGS